MSSRKLTFLFMGLVLIYLSLAFFLPIDPAAVERYGLTMTQLRWVGLAVAAPLVVIWLIAYYGYDKLWQYSRLLGSTPEGAPITTLTRGLMVLVLSLPVTTIASSLLRYLGRQYPDWLTAMTVVTNYLKLLLPLVAFILISIGVRSLTEIGRQSPTRNAVHLITILCAALAAVYTYCVVYFVFTIPGVNTPYYMPLSLVLPTLVVPYLYMWFIGITAAYELYLYNSTLKGKLYRRSWSMVSAGIAGVLLSMILIQFLVTLTNEFNKLSIVNTLLVVYGLLLVMAAGYALVAYGAKRLQRIEEV